MINASLNDDSDWQNDSLLIASGEPRTQRHEQERRSEHAGYVDGDREGGKHLALVSLYRFIGCVLRDSHGRTGTPVSSEFLLRIAYPLLLVPGGS